MTEEEKERLLQIVEDFSGVEELVKYTTPELFYYTCRLPIIKETAKDGSVYDFIIKLFEEKEYYEYCQVLLEAKKEFVEGTIVWNTDNIAYYERFLK